MCIRIAEATVDDVEDFARFLLEAWKGYGPGAPGFAGATDEIVSDLTRPDSLRPRIETPGGFLLLAWQGDRVVAFASMRPLDSGTGELDGIIVLPSHVGAGLGSRLLRGVIDRARAAGLGRLVVRTEASNGAARAFYERHGFEVTGTSVIDVGETPVEVWNLARPLAERGDDPSTRLTG